LDVGTVDERAEKVGNFPSILVCWKEPRGRVLFTEKRVQSRNAPTFDRQNSGVLLILAWIWPWMGCIFAMSRFNHAGSAQRTGVSQQSHKHLTGRYEQWPRKRQRSNRLR